RFQGPPCAFLKPTVVGFFRGASSIIPRIPPFVNTFFALFSRFLKLFCPIRTFSRSPASNL
ncbi:MAG: hypothetical protein PUK79_10635, partial [Clostridiales bacterium]|nr:hypothetical protein [Clostridiales bacterium]